MYIRLIQILMLLALGLLQPATRAEDIDLFSATGSAGSAEAPNVLLVMDNGAGFDSDADASCLLATPTAGTAATGTPVATALSGKAGGIEQCALFNVLQSIAVGSTAKVRIGIMVYKGTGVVTFSGGGCSGSSDGGCLVYPITDFNEDTKVPLLNWIKSWSRSSGNVITAAQADGGVGASMQEAWAYFSGQTGLSGTNYASMKPPVGCKKNFVVYIGNVYGNSHDLGTVQSALEGTIANAGMRANPPASSEQTQIVLPSAANAVTACGTTGIGNSSKQISSSSGNHEGAGAYGDEWARYMASQSITTYGIGLLPPTCATPSKQTPQYPWIMESMATYGGGKYYSTSNYDTLKFAIATVLSEVQSVNSAFAAVSLPVSVNTQGTYLNQVFIGMFRPDANSLPLWLGNLKQYKMGFKNSTFQMLDADGNSAISSSGTDFIAECGRSFWTPPLSAPDAYWSTLAIANCSGYPASSNTPDGNVVEKGGQGYNLRASDPAARVVKTCPLGASCTLADFNTSNTAITPALMGVSTTADKNTLVNWARGQNTQGESGVISGNALTTTQMRPSVHGDVVHSRPVAINFGTDTAPKVVVFYGGNDGMLRAINGNRSEAIDSVAAGSELWSFMPPEFYSKINRRYVNTAQIATLTVTGTPKDYGMDGSVTAYVTGSGDAWVYAGMRRGGRTMYAFNVNHTTPSAITAKWKVGCDSSGCFTASGTTGNNGNFDGMGQSWAIPKVFRASGYGSGASPMLVMGGGYDAACEDASSFSCASTTGNHIYVMDADSGKLLKVFDTTRGVTGDVLMLQDGSGMATYGYAADLGGNVYRISGATAGDPIGATAPANWTITRIAALGCDTPGTCTSPPNRKFIFGPDVVVEGGFNILLIGSGDREKPVNYTNTVQNYFFMLKDRPSDSSWLTSEAVSGRCGTGNAVLCLASLAPPISVGTCTTPTNQQKGWALQLASTEQVVTSAITVVGTAYFSTHQPVEVSANSCTSSLGRSRAYAISYTNASSATGCKADGTTDNTFVLLQAGGLPPSPVAGKVKLDDGTIVPFVIGAKGPLQSTAVKAPGSNPRGTKIRSYWYIRK